MRKIQHIALDEKSQGGWAAAPSYTIHTDDARVVTLQHWANLTLVLLKFGMVKDNVPHSLSIQAGNKQAHVMRPMMLSRRLAPFIASNAPKVTIFHMIT